MSATGGVDFVGLGYLYGNISCFVAFFPRKGTMGDIDAFFMDFLVYVAIVCFRKKKIFSYISLCLRHGAKSAHVRQSTTGRNDTVLSF